MNFKRRYYLFMTRKPIPIKNLEPLFVYNYDGAEIEISDCEKDIDKTVREILKKMREEDKWRITN